MNSETKAATELTLPQRAAVALGESANEAKLRELAAKSANIVTVTNKDGREEAHRAGMVLRSTRTAIAATGKAAREDATAFSKAVIAMEKDLIAIIEPEEVRVLALRDGFDAEEKARKDALIAAEVARMAAIQARLDVMRDIPLRCVGVSAAGIGDMISALVESELSVELFGEKLSDACDLKQLTLSKLVAQQDAAYSAEAEAARIKAEREAEDARRAEESAELARQRAEQQRVAAEQAAAAKALQDAAAAQEAETKRLRDQAAAEQAERERIASEAQARANAELKAAQDKLAADIAAHESKVKAEREAANLAADHADALIDNVAFDVAREQLAAFSRDLHHAEALEMNAHFDAAKVPEPVDVIAAIMDADEIEPTDEEIVDAVAEAFGMTTAQAKERLSRYVVEVAA